MIIGLQWGVANYVYTYTHTHTVSSPTSTVVSPTSNMSVRLRLESIRLRLKWPSGQVTNTRNRKVWTKRDETLFSLAYFYIRLSNLDRISFGRNQIF